MSEVFNFRRFWTFFKYDLKQMWRNHFKVALFLGFLPLLLYIVWVICSLSFTREWTAPGIAVRAGFFYLAVLVIILYQARTYGHLTDRRKGANYLMIPASVTEKFTSMMVITLIVIPLLFAGVYFLLDGFLSLVDPHYGSSLVGGAKSLLSRFLQAEIWEDAVMPKSMPNIFFVLAVIGIFVSMVYYLLSGLVFKKWKILGGLLVNYGFSLVLTIFAGLFMTGEKVKDWLERTFNDMGEDQALQFFTNTLNWSTVASVVILVALMTAVYFRIKTIKH